VSSLESETARPQTEADQQAEIAALRARVAELEQQLVEVEAWANESLGAAQERLYWLDRWHLDLNAVMARPAAGRVRAIFRFTRSVYRGLRSAKRRLLGA
jgi:hypothetical protein